jgi:L-aspartate oxidase
MKQYDFVIVGSGIAGLYTALLARPHGSVLIVTKGQIDDCNTRFAQGGIAAALAKNDSVENHFQDTVIAGNDLCDEAAVRILAEEAPARIDDLVKLGVPFDTVDGEIALTLEAAHSVSRIAHAGGDATGAHIEDTLSERIRADRIDLLENFLATNIIVGDQQVQGVRTLSCYTGEIQEFGCRYLIIATGGAGQLFKYTTNPQIATGDGIALAFNSGAEIVDTEFFQFHPTTLILPEAEPFLISEAVRGEGAVLRNQAGHSFMTGYHPDGDLAARDIVARSILYEMQKTGTERVYLDTTVINSRRLTTRFPTIYRYCREHGLDITREQIPISPAAHYLMGGIRTNHWGETSIPGLYAVGEVACTGVHGANRLASNSLIEVLVFARRIIDGIKAGRQPEPSPEGTPAYHLNTRGHASDLLPPLNRENIRELMWRNAGIIRDRHNLDDTARILAAWQSLLPPVNNSYTFEMASLILCGRLLTEAAIIREESRGAHFRADFPNVSPQWKRHITLTK